MRGQKVPGLVVRGQRGRRSEGRGLLLGGVRSAGQGFVCRVDPGLGGLHRARDQ